MAKKNIHTFLGHPVLFFSAVLALNVLLCNPFSFAAEDNNPPTIELHGRMDSRTVYTDKVYIAGKVTDENPVGSLTLNGASLTYEPGRSISFSHLAALAEGRNRLVIEAVDKAGNRSQKRITIIREEPDQSGLSLDVIAGRLRVALYPFEIDGSLTAESSLFLDLLTLRMQEENRFQIIERSSIERILQEQKLNLTQLVDENIAIKVGRLMAAQAIVTGSIVTTADGTAVVSRMIDTETSEIQATEKIRTAASGLDAMDFIAEALASELHNDFPMLHGLVIKRKDRHIYTDLGKDSIPPHGRLIIYRLSDPEDAGGSMGTVLGYARVTEILQDASKAEIIDGNPDEIRVLDKVVVQ